MICGGNFLNGLFAITDWPSRRIRRRGTFHTASRLSGVIDVGFFFLWVRVMVCRKAIMRCKSLSLVIGGCVGFVI